MGITERVDQMVVRVSSPTGSVSAQIHGRGDVQVSFAPGFYYRADEHEVEAQLTQVARLLWTARTRAYNAILTDEYHDKIVIEPRPISQLDLQFHEQRDNLVAQGRSADGRVELSVRGMQEWKVRIAPGTLRELRENEFANAVAVAARQLISDQQEKIRELKVQTYSPEFVADYQEATA